MVLAQLITASDFELVKLLATQAAIGLALLVVMLLRGDIVTRREYDDKVAENLKLRSAVDEFRLLAAAATKISERLAG